MKKILLTLALVFVVGTGQKPAQASSIIGATEPTQILNNIQLVLQVYEQYETWAKLVEQYENMLENTEKWEELFFGRGMDLILELNDAVNKDQLLSYIGEITAEEFAEKYPGYEEYLEVEVEDWTADKIAEEHLRWNTAYRKNIEGAINAANLQNEEFETEEELIEGLKVQSTTAIGRQQILEAGNSIAIEGLRQNQKLRQLLMTQVQLQSNYQAYESSKDAAKRALAAKHAEALKEAHETEIITGDGEQF